MPLLDERVSHLSASIRELTPGPLSELRRMDPDGPLPPAFWMVSTPLRLDDRELPAWIGAAKAIAMLAEKGRQEDRPKIHDPARHLGALFCDGGDPGWPGTSGTSKPMLSEARFARLLAAPPAARGPMLLRVVRWLAGVKPPGTSVDCADIVRILTRLDDPGPLRKLARDYYRRLDSARRADPTPSGDSQ